MRQAALSFVLILCMACSGSDAPAPAADAAPTAPAADGSTPPAEAVAPASVPPAGRPVIPPDAPRFAMDANIKAPVREAVQREQARLIDAARDDKPAVLESLFEPERLPQSPQAAREFFERLRDLVAGSEVAAWHEIHFIPEGTEPILVATEDTDGVLVAVPAAGPEVYVLLQRLRADLRDGLLAAIWVKRADRWRLVTLRLGALRLAGKSATDWYHEAQALAADGMRLPAWLRLTVADDLLDSVPFVQYAHADAAKALQARLADELAALRSFPLTLSDVANRPQVVRIDPTFLQGSLSPAVHYVTRLSLQDAQLTDEAQAVADALSGLYPGFCYGATRVALAAYDELPSDPRREYVSVAFVASCP